MKIKRRKNERERNQNHTNRKGNAYDLVQHLARPAQTSAAIIAPRDRPTYSVATTTFFQRHAGAGVQQRKPYRNTGRGAGYLQAVAANSCNPSLPTGKDAGYTS